MEPSPLDPIEQVAAIIARWTYGTGVPRLGGPPFIFLLPAPAGWPAAGAIDEPPEVRATAAPRDDDDATAAVLAEDSDQPAATAEVEQRQEAAQEAHTATRADRDAAPTRPSLVAARARAPEAPRHEAELRLDKTIHAPDPWSIMPSRTLRGAGARHLQRRGDPLEAPETLGERVAREGPDAPTPRPTATRWNLLIVPSQAGFRASDQGVKALVLYLDRSQLLRSPTVSTVEEFVGHPLHPPEEYWRKRLHGGDPDDAAQIISLTPGVFSHQLFYEGAAPADGSPIIGAHIGHRAKSVAVPFGPADRKAAFWLVLTGCRHQQVSRGFLERIHSILYLRPIVFAVPYTAEHEPAAE